MVTKQVTDEELLTLLEVMEEFRALKAEVPAQAIVTFLYVATHNPCMQSQLQKDLKMHSSSASRNTDMFSDIDRLGKPGPNLIKKEPDPLNATRAVISLTPRGERFALTIKRILYGS